MNELLTHTRGVAAFLASVRIEVNTSASKYEAVTRALEKNASLLKEVKDQQKGLAVEVQLLKTSIAANSPEARNEMEQSLLKCKTVYVDALKIAFTDAESTNDVWKGPSGTAGLMAKVVSDTLNVTEDEAAVIVNGRREVPLSAKDAKENRTIPRVVPNAKMFNDRRATFFMQLGQAAVDAWKRKVDFPSDPEEALVAAVRWLNRDKYLKSKTGFEGVVEATVAAFEWLGCKNHFWVDPVDVGDVGHVRALLGHFSFASVKVRVELVKIIRQVKNPKYKMDNHRPHWLLETHRLYFYLLGRGSWHKDLVLKDKGDRSRAKIDRVLPAVPCTTTAILPSEAGASDPIATDEPDEMDVAAAARVDRENAAIAARATTASGLAGIDGVPAAAAGATGRADETAAAPADGAIRGAEQDAAAAGDSEAVDGATAAGGEVDDGAAAGGGEDESAVAAASAAAAAVLAGLRSSV